MYLSIWKNASGSLCQTTHDLFKIYGTPNYEMQNSKYHWIKYIIHLTAWVGKFF